MGSNFLSPPAKRPISYIISSSMSDPNNSSNGSSSFPTPSKRTKPPRQPLHVPPGHAAFRLLCHACRVGGVIGKSGAVIKSLQQSTGAKIRVEDALPECPDRVVTVMAPAAISSKISLSSGNLNEQSWEIGGEIEVSKAQEALLRVFERILEVAAETDWNEVGVGTVSCRVLAEKSQVGSVIGKGGKMVKQIRKESGCKIKVLADKLPACANPGEEMIEIEGNVQGVKKALILIGHCLQECPPSDKTRTLSSSNTVEAVLQQSLTDFCADPPQRNPALPATSTSNSYASGFDPLSFDVAHMTPVEVKPLQQEVSFKILCPVDKVGGVIGRGGTIIKALENETGASISVGPIIPGCDERLITVTASENPDSQFSPAQKAAILVFSRSVEVGPTKGQDPGLGKDNSIIARLLIPSNQVGCLLGKGGSIVSEIRRVTGAGIRIMKRHQVPKSASVNDEVVQISGEFSSVQDALYNVTGRLRDNILPSSRLSATASRSSSSLLAETSPYGRIKDPAPLGLDSLGLSTSYSRQPIVSQGTTDHLGAIHNLDNSLSPSLWESPGVAGVSHGGVTEVGRGLASLRSGLEFSSRSKCAIVTNTTVEIAVPEEVIHCVYGENGRNLARLRQISGAKVAIHDPLPGKGERAVVISGSPDEVQAAQSLLHAFILTGS